MEVVANGLEVALGDGEPPACRSCLNLLHQRAITPKRNNVLDGRRARGYIPIKVFDGGKNYFFVAPTSVSCFGVWRSDGGSGKNVYFCFGEKDS